MKQPFIHDHFLLQTDSARTLYHEYAANMPLVDYHCHLSPSDLATNRQFNNLFEIWLEGDHYKWRAMRADGVAERLCTGAAEPYEKFLAYAGTVPVTLRNPLYHWTHLELKRYFGIDELLNTQSAPAIWEQANDMLARPELSVWGILEKFKVRLIGTTDDPTDSLEHHLALRDSKCPARVVPTFRPDKAFLLANTAGWNQWVDKLESVSGQSCSSLSMLLSVLEQRMDYFAELGCLAADHGIERCPEMIAGEAAAEKTFAAARAGRPVSSSEEETFVGFLLAWLGERYAERKWIMQLHLGAMRNVNAALFKELGPDIGCDSITDCPQMPGLRCILGELSRRGKLPRTILYNLNPAENYPIATMCGNFFEEGVPGKMQFGSGWWFLDQEEGMTWQLNALSNLGLLANFIGMLTDSRSFMSFPRHEYFRRILCNLIGRDIDNGLLPDSIDMAANLVQQVCYGNAATTFRLHDN